MIPGIEPFYQQIATAIDEKLEGTEWKRARIDAIFYPGHILFTSSYQISATGPWTREATDLDVIRPFRAMRELFRNAEKPLWGRARFSIESTGKFNLQLSYDDCDEDGFARFDEAAEREWQKLSTAGVDVPLLGAKNIYAPSADTAVPKKKPWWRPW